MAADFARRVAMGDPQAPFSKVLAILRRHELLGADGRLRPEVQLVSMGDHFDWGRRSDRRAAARSAMELVQWLTAHPPEQVILIAGNHDLARVGELAGFDADRFRAAQAEADLVYRDGESDEQAEREFLKRYPDVPTAELVSRDFATFEPSQRSLVEELLRTRRLRLAYAAGPDLLLCHAGVTVDDLQAAGLPSSLHHDAFAAAEALNRALDSNTYREAGRLIVSGLHRPGDASFGEGRGILYHRPSHPGHEDSELFQRPWARRFDPRRLPRGLTQAIGHIRDNKCRQLLKEWASPEPAEDGPLRSLQTDGASVRYARGVVAGGVDVATMWFLDGGMAHAPVERYELLELDA